MQDLERPLLALVAQLVWRVLLQQALMRREQQELLLQMRHQPRHRDVLWND
jgi:hypothetical protein